jgi:hypothetical protein
MHVNVQVFIDQTTVPHGQATVLPLTTQPRSSLPENIPPYPASLPIPGSPRPNREALCPSWR